MWKTWNKGFLGSGAHGPQRKAEGRKGKMGELVESRQMFKAERSQSHREGSLGDGRREGERPHEAWGGGCCGRRLPETLLHPCQCVKLVALKSMASWRTWRKRQDESGVGRGAEPCVRFSIVPLMPFEGAGEMAQWARHWLLLQRTGWCSPGWVFGFSPLACGEETVSLLTSMLIVHLPLSCPLCSIPSEDRGAKRPPQTAREEF